jgi:catechol 2,3-dioxygenase-like lactoylglutathione lyase family enzyme
LGDSPSGASDPYLRLHAVRVFVRDQDRSLRFYLEQLGFKLAFDARLPSGQRWVAVALPTAVRCSLSSHPVRSRRSSYTDGVTEAFDEAGEEFGETRLIQAVRRDRGLSSEGLLASIVDDVQTFSPRGQHDDITLIVARCRGK